MVFLSMVSLGFGQTTLSAGDIAITGFHSDNPDQFSFILLTDVTNGTSINFTDNGWFSSGGFRDNEGTLTWVADADFLCGTEIIITETVAGTSIYAATSGTATESNLGFSLATVNGDQIIAYQGLDASPTFIYAVNFDGAGWSDATSPNDTALPTGLTDGINAIGLGQIDNASYNCTVTSDTALILAGISNTSNWTLDNAPIPIGGCYYSCEACTGGSVTWNGTWSGNPDLTTQVIISANYNTSNGGSEISFSACSLKVEDGATLNIADNTFVQVENNLTVDSGGAINIQPHGAFIQNNDLSNAINNGTITVDKVTAPMDAWYEYTYWSSPVSGETIAGAITDSEPSRRFIFNGQNFLDANAESNNDNTLVAGQDDIDDNGNDWQLVSGTTEMQAGIGYATTLTEFAFDIAPGTNNKTFRFTFTGNFNNGVINVPIYRNDSELNDNNWNFIGNPYPSAIDADAFLAANANVQTGVTNSTGAVDGAIFLWSQNTLPSATANGNEDQNFSDADYAVINGVGGTAGGDGETPNRFIPSGQGFFVSMSNSAPATVVSGDVYTSNVTFSNSMRVFGTTENSQFFKNSNSKNNSTLNKLWLNLTSDNGIFNQTLIGYVNGATNADDGSYYDAKKMDSPNIFASLYSIIENSDKKFGIQGKASASLNEDEIIQLGFSTKINVATLYKLSIAQLQGDFLTNTPIYLKDNLLNKTHDLSTSDYTFTSDVGEFNTRFEILFGANSLTTEDAILDSKSLRIVALENDRVQFHVADNLIIKTVRIYDLLGRQLYNLKGNNASETYNLSNLNEAIYIAKVELSNGALITKKAVKR